MASQKFERLFHQLAPRNDQTRNLGVASIKVGNDRLGIVYIDWLPPQKERVASLHLLAADARKIAPDDAVAEETRDCLRLRVNAMTATARRHGHRVARRALVA